MNPDRDIISYNPTSVQGLQAIVAKLQAENQELGFYAESTTAENIMLKRQVAEQDDELNKLRVRLRSFSNKSEDAQEIARLQTKVHELEQVLRLKVHELEQALKQKLNYGQSSA